MQPLQSSAVVRALQAAVFWLGLVRGLSLHVHQAGTTFLANQTRTKAATAKTNVAARRLYLDLGANWANTMRLFEDLGDKRTEKPWDVFAFEASPFIQPYLEKFTAWLNHKGSKPAVTVPPSGSSKHLNMFASRYGCPSAPLNDQAFSPKMNAMRSCMLNVFKVPLSHLHPDQSLNSTALIQEKLDTAKTAPSGQNRFVSVPAAAGARAGMLELGAMTPQQMIRGGAISSKVPGTPTMKVPIVDIPQWLAQHYTASDYIIVKMDIEGAEFQILDTLLSGPNACLIDVLAMECHPVHGNCEALKSKIRQHPCITLLLEDAGYRAWDHYSSPDIYYAQQPR